MQQERRIINSINLSFKRKYPELTDPNLFINSEDDSISFGKDYYEEVIFENISDTDTTIKEKEFYNCTFRNAAFNFSKFIDCRFEECSFIGCDLSLTKFQICSFLDVSFSECKLVGIDWTGNAKPFRVNYDKCKLNDSIFFSMDLRALNFASCEAHNADFEKANLTKAELCGTDLLESKFNGANLTQADFSGAFNYNIDPTQCKLKKAKFTLPEAISLLSHLDIIIE